MLQLKNLTIYRRGSTICRDLYLEVGKGSVLIISGKNGSGKSTLAACLSGQLKPQSGQVLLDHYDLHNLSAKEKTIFLESTGIVMQDGSLRPFDTVRSLIEKVNSGPKETQELLYTFEINNLDEQLVHELSFSQKKRLELVLSLAKKPKLIIWDDPFLGLDRVGIEKLKNLLAREKSMGTTIVLISNNLDDFIFLNPEKMLNL